MTEEQEMRTLWFSSYQAAVKFARGNDLDQVPEKRPVWLDYAWREEWSLRVPTDWTPTW